MITIKSLKDKIYYKMLLTNGVFYKRVDDNHLQATLDQVFDTTKKFDGLTAVSNKSKALIEILFRIFGPSESEKCNVILYEYIQDCYSRTIDDFLQLFNDDIELEVLKESSNFLLKAIDIDELFNKHFDYKKEFCYDEKSDLNNFIYELVIGYMQSLTGMNIPGIYRLKWNKILCHAKELFYNESLEYSRLFEEKESPLASRIVFYDLKESHIASLKSSLHEPLYGNDALNFKSMYCSIPSRLNMNNEITEGTDKEMLLKWYNDKKKQGLLFIKGNPGSGKSFIQKSFLDTLCNDGKIVFFIELYDFTLTRPSVLEDIQGYFKKKYPLFKYCLNMYPSDSFDEIEELQDAIYILDGFDEIKGFTSSIDSLKFINTLYLLAKSSYTILSGRKYMFDFLSDKLDNLEYSTLEIKDLDDINAEKMVKKYSALLNIVNPPTIKSIKDIDEEFVKTPILIFLYVFTVGENHGIKNKADLYDLIVKTSYKRSYRENPKTMMLSTEGDAPYSYKSYLNCLKVIGFTAYKELVREISVEKCKEVAVGLHIKNFNFWIDTANKNSPLRILLQFFLKGDIKNLYFYHMTFVEYFTALQIIDFVLKFGDCDTADHYYIKNVKDTLSNNRKAFFSSFIIPILNEFDRFEFSVYKTNLSDMIMKLFKEASQYAIRDIHSVHVDNCFKLYINHFLFLAISHILIVEQNINFPFCKHVEKFNFKHCKLLFAPYAKSHFLDNIVRETQFYMVDIDSVCLEKSIITDSTLYLIGSNEISICECKFFGGVLHINSFSTIIESTSFSGTTLTLTDAKLLNMRASCVFINCLFQINKCLYSIFLKMQNTNLNKINTFKNCKVFDGENIYELDNSPSEAIS